jgi:hypothetical protein
MYLDIFSFDSLDSWEDEQEEKETILNKDKEEKGDPPLLRMICGVLESLLRQGLNLTRTKDGTQLDVVEKYRNK